MKINTIRILTLIYHRISINNEWGNILFNFPNVLCMYVIIYWLPWGFERFFHRVYSVLKLSSQSFQSFSLFFSLHQSSVAARLLYLTNFRSPLLSSLSLASPLPRLFLLLPSSDFRFPLLFHSSTFTLSFAPSPSFLCPQPFFSLFCSPLSGAPVLHLISVSLLLPFSNLFLYPSIPFPPHSFFDLSLVPIHPSFTFSHLSSFPLLHRILNSFPLSLFLSPAVLSFFSPSHLSSSFSPLSSSSHSAYCFCHYLLFFLTFFHLFTSSLFKLPLSLICTLDFSFSFTSPT